MSNNLKDNFHLIAYAFNIKNDSDPLWNQLYNHINNNPSALKEAVCYSIQEWSKCSPLPADDRGQEVYWKRLQSLRSLIA